MKNTKNVALLPIIDISLLYSRKVWIVKKDDVKMVSNLSTIHVEYVDFYNHAVKRLVIYTPSILASLYI